LHQAKNRSFEECGWKDGGRGGSAQYVATWQDEQDKTNLTHTGLLMEGVGNEQFINMDAKLVYYPASQLAIPN
jgi:hypothetical protein